MTRLAISFDPELVEAVVDGDADRARALIALGALKLLAARRNHAAAEGC